MVPHAQQAPKEKDTMPPMSLDGIAEEVAPLPQPTRMSRPDNTRSSTDPGPSPSLLLLQGYLKDKDWSKPSQKSRNRSPYSRSHLRSRSSGAVTGVPLMTRSHSLPIPPTARAFETPISGRLSPVPQSSPMRPPARTRSPFHAQDSYPLSQPSPAYPDTFGPTLGGAIESIQEDTELSIPPPRTQSLPMHTSRVPSSSRRRPASPLHTAPTSNPATILDQATTLPGASSPSLGPHQKYITEAHPSLLLSQQQQHHQQPYQPQLHSYPSSSSISTATSTPSSARSRSPSISSLDTIEDEPEMESEAEVEVIERLKRAADGEDEGRRSSLDGGGRGFGFTRGRSEKKRWSVCGGERRGDLDLETIWED